MYVFAEAKSFFCIREEDGDEVEEGKRIWYYSTKVQLGELINVLDKEFWENDLCGMLEELREEIHVHMDITEDLTNKARVNNKAYLTVANGKQQEHQQCTERRALVTVNLLFCSI